MSGPKCGEWLVETNLERERRITAEIRTRIRGLQKELRSVKSAWLKAITRFGEEFPSPPENTFNDLHDSATIEALRSHEGKLHNDLTNHREALSDAEATYKVRDILKNIAKSQSRQRRHSREPGTVSARQITQDTVRRRKADVARVAERLSSLISIEERATFERSLGSVTEQLETTKFDGLLLELRLAVQTLNSQQRKRARDQTFANELVNKLTGLEGTAVESLKQELRDVQLGKKKLRSGIQVELSKVVAASIVADDRRYAAKVILEELGQLGYTTEAGMETVLVNGGELEVTRPELKEYSVRFHVDQDRELFDVRLKRSGDVGEVAGSERRMRDRSMEERWCSDFASALSSASERGVVARITKQENPGAVPVEVVKNMGGNRTRSTHKARSRRLPS